MIAPTRRQLLTALALLTSLSLLAALAIFLNGRAAPDDRADGTLSVGPGPQAVRLTVAASGIYAVAASDLRDAGMPVADLSVGNWSLTRDGQPVPFFVRDDEAGPTLYFYGQAITTTMEPPAVYWLAPGTGLDMAVRASEGEADVAPAPAAQTMGLRETRWEENKVFLAQSTGADLWLGPLLFAPGTLEIPLEGIAPSDAPASLRLRIWSNNEAAVDPDHHLLVSLNGSQLADVAWDGIRQQDIQADVPAGVLRPQGNVLELTAPGDTGAAGEQLYVDWVALDYSGVLDAGDGQIAFHVASGPASLRQIGPDGLILDVTEPAAPTIVAGVAPAPETGAWFSEGLERRYHAARRIDAFRPGLSAVPMWESLRLPGRGADYVMIVADEPGMAEALAPLVARRTSQGLAVSVINVTQIFDEFGYGRRDEAAIRAFLRHAIATWQPAPRFALLVGDASYDVNDLTGGQNRNLLPTHLVNTHFAGYVASDTWFTLPADGSLMPALAIGRFPAQTEEQVATMVAKTIRYEESADGGWVSHALLVADDEPAFDVASDELAAQLERVGYLPERLYMTANDDGEFNRQAILGALSQGVGILNYVGHGSIDVWGDEKVLSVADAGQLSNDERLPIFTTFTCLNGYFNHPQVDALAESLLRARNGGIAAAVAPSGRTTTNQQAPLAEQFYAALLTGRAVTLGEALQEAKAAAADRPSLQDVIHTFNLLGDPALHFALP